MPFLDTLQNAAFKILPEKKSSLPMQGSNAGIGNGGVVPFEDDAGGFLVFLLFIPLLSTIWIWMIVSKPAIIFHVSQVFFNFLAMCTMAGAAAFQAKFKVGPSGLSGFAIFIAVIGILYSLFILLVPVVYEKYDRGARLARALRETRVSFILSGAGTSVSLLMAFIVTISAWTEAGCKNPDRDPHADLGDDFKKGLGGFCSTKKAAAIFFWLVFVFWLGSLTLTILDWRNGKATRPRDPPFTHPIEASEGSVYERADHDDEASDEEEGRKPYQDTHYSPFSDTNRISGVPSNGSSADISYQPPSAPAFGSQPASRPSFDTYGAFDDPTPTGFAGGFASGAYGSPAQRPNASSPTKPSVSRTMEFADPYAAIRASIGQTPPADGPPPPGYSSYSAYR